MAVDTQNDTIVQRIDYDVWGNVLLDKNPASSPSASPAGCMTATPASPALARNYDLETGRWAAKDSIIFAGSDANIFAYVHNDPVNRSDPERLTELDEARE